MSQKRETEKLWKRVKNLTQEQRAKIIPYFFGLMEDSMEKIHIELLNERITELLRDTE